MTRESRILLFVIVGCTIALAVFQYYLQMKFLGVNLQVAHDVTQQVKETTTVGQRATPTVEATESASPSASVKSRTASPSALLKPRTTEIPEATAETSESDE